MEDVCDTYASAGLWPAMEKFTTLVGIQGGGPPPARECEPSPAMRESMALMRKNMEFFFGRYVRNIARYRPDFTALQACSCRIVPAVGAESQGQLAHDGGLGLAKRLGKEATIFPGNHGGFDGRAAEFAAKLCEVLNR